MDKAHLTLRIAVTATDATGIACQAETAQLRRLLGMVSKMLGEIILHADDADRVRGLSGSAKDMVDTVMPG